MRTLYRIILANSICVLTLAFASPSDAHYLWINRVTVDGKPQGLVYFGADPTDEGYHFPDKLSNTKLWSRAADRACTEVATKKIDTDDRVGLIGPVTRQSPVLEASQVYGIYGTSLLVYHAKHVDGTSAKSINSAGASKELALDIVPHVNGKAVQIAVLWKGKPLANADVSIFDGDSEPIDKKTDKDGRLSFVPESGKLIGVLATTTKNDKAGTQEGKSYKGVVHYSSLTFNLPGKDSVALNDSAAAEHSTSESKTHAKTTALMPPLPEPLASFGAVVADGWLYVYGGHIGEEHEHSAANLSKHFRRIKLDGGTTWQELPMQTPLQGLPLVAHGGKIYRIGGLNERNPTTDQAEDLHSTADFAEYDPATNKWTALARCLPLGRLLMPR